MTVKNRKPEKVLLIRIIRNVILLFMYFTGFLFAIINSPATAQTIYGNEWINTKQTYLRFPVVQTGFYEITSEELRSAGLPIDDIAAASFQIFRCGKELAIEVKSDVSGTLGDNGSISFYGEKNDGARDSLLYVSPAVMPHAHYSLYSDTAAYFLTWKYDGGIGERISRSPEFNTTKALNYHFEETSELFNSNYFTGNFYPTGSNFDNGTVLSTYDTGEGWTGKELNNARQTIDINTSNLVREQADQTEVELTMTGRSAGNHEIELWTGTAAALGRKITTLTILNYNSLTYKFSLNKEDIPVNGKIAVSIHAKEKTGSVSVSYVKWRYPQKTVLPTNSSQKIYYFNKDLEANLWKTGSTGNWKFYDCSDPYNLHELKQNNDNISVAGVSKIIGYQEPLKVNSLKLINFKSDDALQADYLIITHPLVRKPVNEIDPVLAYASYRASKEGGSYKPFIIESQEIYDHFNYGEPGPLGIRNMIADLHKNGKLKFVFIIGRSIDPQTARKLSNARDLDMIPNAGWPGSDLALSMGIGGNPTYVPVVPVGRINATNSQEVWAYLQKVKAMEAEPASAPWRKNILHLSGGRSRDELLTFKEYVNSFENKIAGSALGANVQTISKETEAEVEQFPIHIPVNKGVALMTLYGHSGLDVTDIDIGYASDEKREYNNAPFYPAVIVNGCALGSVFYSTKTISTDWIFSPKNGAVLFLAHTFNGVSSALKHYTDSFYEVLADSQFVSEPFGIIQQEAIRRNMLVNPTLSDGIAAQQMNLHGDPAIRIFPAKLPDYTFDSTATTFSDPSGKKLSVWSDSIRIQIGIVNNGRFRNENYQLVIKGNSESSNPVVLQSLHHAVSNADTLVLKIKNPFKKSGKQSWNFTIDPENLLTEEIKTNNNFTKEFIFSEDGAFPLLPLPDYVTNQQKIELVAQIPIDRNSAEIIFEWDTTSSFSTSQTNSASVENFISHHTILISDRNNQKIFWRVYLPEDQKRPSQSRSITYLPNASSSPKLPEGVAFIVEKYSSEIQEGDNFRANATFQNVTDIAFKNSLSVMITHIMPEKTETIFSKIPVLESNEIRNLQLDSETTGKAGLHKISVVFNTDKLPEEIYYNNEVNFSYQVVPDKIPPFLNVSVDGRQLVDNDFVSSQPIIGIQVLDENKFLIRKDTSGIELWLKEDCLTCLEKQIPLSNAKIQILPLNDFQIWLKLSETLKNGSYQLRVKAADLSKNRAVDYQIRFRVTDTSQIINAGVSPNPSKQWFRFYLELEGSLPNNEVNIIIYDLSGREINQIQASLHPGQNEWFWYPENLPAGLYFYRIETNMNKSSSSGKEINGLRGKLIWVR